MAEDKEMEIKDFNQIIDSIMVYKTRVDDLLKALMGQEPRTLSPAILIATMAVMGADQDMTTLAEKMRDLHPKEFGK